MSRTGVSVRVLVDDMQLDDGCLPWNNPPESYTPWVTTRTNLVNDPRGLTLAGYGWSTAQGALAGIPGGGGVVYTRTVTGGARVIEILMGSLLQTGTQVTIKGQVMTGTPLNVFARPNTSTPTGQLTVATIPGSVGAWQDFELTFTMLEPGSDTAGVVMVDNTGAVGDKYQFRKLDIEMGPPPLGAYFDGSTASPDEFTRYVWSVEINASPSEMQTRQLAPPGPPAYWLPQGMWADEGLKITWGRTDTMAQPTPSSCTFRVSDTTDTSYMDAFKIGSTVQILADATVTGGATVPAFTDPDFETEVRATTINSTVSRDNRHVETGLLAAVMKPINMSSAYSARFPPGTLQTAGTNPAAWDTIPHLGPGETWQMAVRLWIPQGLLVNVRPVVYQGPYAGAATLLPILATLTGTGAWVTVQGPVTPGLSVGWLGVQVEATGGLAWRDEPDSVTWASLPTDLQWRDLSDIYVDNISILAPPGGTQVTILVFGGRITDMEALYDTAAPALDITATDFLGDLGNRFVGDTPWLKETLQARMLRVLQLAQVPGEKVITADVAPTLAPTQLSWEDVDHRAASGLLADMANSVDGVMWSATHVVSGPFVKLEDPAMRPALYQLQLVDGYIEIGVINTDALPVDQRPLDVSACDVLRDPVRFLLDVSDIGTRTTVTWLDQTLDDKGLPAPTERTVATIDDSREAAYGTRNISVQTLLTTSAAASAISERLLARASGEWRMDGLVVSDADFQVPDQVAVNVLVQLLDGVTRGGKAIRVVDLPIWSPLGDTAPAYVEGGTYAYNQGGWELALTVSRATGLGTSARWDELPASWTWDQFDPSLTWDELRGVAAPPATP